jgi:hypothetical protein
MNLKDKDFLYNNSVEYKYDYFTDCESYGCDSICRCGRIEDATVEVDLKNLVNELYNFYLNSDTVDGIRDNKLRNLLYGTNKEFDLYTIDRIVRKVRIWDTYNWDIGVQGGYYGEEMDDIKIEAATANQIDTYVGCAFSLSFNEQVEFLMKLEYEYLLDDLKDVDYEIVTLNKSDIVFPNKDYHKNLIDESFLHYDDLDYDGIRGVVLLKNGHYKLIDGYHRMTSTKSETVRVILAKSK